MASPTIKQKLARELDNMPPALQQRVLDYARSLTAPGNTPLGVPGNHLLKFAGVLSKEDADAITKAIEEMCEQVAASERPAM